MWEKQQVIKALELLKSFAMECWQIDMVEASETFQASIEVLEQQLKMLNGFEIESE